MSLLTTAPPIAISVQSSHLSTLETQCTNLRDLQMVHAHFIKTGQSKNSSVASRILSFCITKPDVDINYAYRVFSQIENPNLFSWNTIIRGFSNSSIPKMSILLFIDMLVNSSVQPQRLTYPSLFKAYSQLGKARDGAQLHGRVIKQGLQFDPFVRNTLLCMYSSCGYLPEARKCFNEDCFMDAVAWNTMLMGFAKCGKIDIARNLFDEMPVRNQISWNSMISGYVRNGKWAEALLVFRQMQDENIQPNEFTVVSLLNASARLGALKQGEWLHDYVKRNPQIEMNTIIVTALIDMYCKCGIVESAWIVFDSAPRKGLSCWNSMILGLANNGHGNKAIEMFTRLQRSNIEPDKVSFIGVLTACNHLGSVIKARDYFRLMINEYRIKPSIEHYGCLVDTLSRGGLIKEAEEVIRNMKGMVNPDAVIWGSLLWGCNRYGKLELGKWAAEKLREVNSNESSGYVLMHNGNAANGDFEKGVKERMLMKEKKIGKVPGCSSIEIDGQIHEFVASGNCHSIIQSKNHEIFSLLM
ncbi:pentatricopeptide repeat-containing protein At2g42920, chloroplastic [Impatiens glandulifera]|uniref:pentatricopeptide repeat-containing protein At2g42920, chloroplastic n=1 Tax=Impatiens glandulifera TaxID=253017 RepID=UPI001FB10FBE|nr:pentatricopeptide repeat-containing protein At2g42920, chloroplastic [Impatiens glandulifera]